MDSPSRVSVRISPLFWLSSCLIGWLSSGGIAHPLLSMGIWVLVIFISVLVHELGHALVALLFGRRVRIELIAFGGVTHPTEPRLKGRQEFLMVLMGPLFGFVLYLLATFCLAFFLFTTPLLLYAFTIFQWVNLVWTLANLIPIIPLDGGQLVRILCEAAAGLRGVRVAFLFSMLLAGVGSVAFFLFGYFLMGSFFFLFAFQNFEQWRRAKLMTEIDQNEEIKKELDQIEKLMRVDQNQAMLQLESIQRKLEKGLLFVAASQTLASLYKERGEYQKVYALLYPLKEDLSDDSIILLHQAAYELKQFALVIELAGRSFQICSDSTTALRNAEACASCKKVEPTIGWLQAAHRLGSADLLPLLKRKAFDPVRQDPLFKEFLLRFLA